MPPKSSAADAKGGKTTNDCLFLMEVLVDKITFFKSPCFADTSLRTTVTIAVPKIATIEIGDDEGNGGESGPYSKTFNSGKSCLFSMQEVDVKSFMTKFLVNVSIAKSLPCSCLPARIQLGKADIDMTKEFVEARNKNLADPNAVSYQALQDTFRLLGDDNSETGEITMFLRISCFGGMIMTKFQGSGGPLTLGAGASGNIDRSCNPRKSYQTDDEPCTCGSKHGGGGKQGSGTSMGEVCRGGGSGTCPPARDPYNIMPCEEGAGACFCTGPHPVVKSPLDCRAADVNSSNMPKACCPPGNKVIFQLPSDMCAGHKNRTHFTFTSDGVGDMTREEPGQLVPNTSEDYQGAIYDYGKAVYKLRIGKYIEMPGRKSKLEYQFITPVISFDSEVPVQDNRSSQWKSCCPTCCGPTHMLPRCP